MDDTEEWVQIGESSEEELGVSSEEELGKSSEKDAMIAALQSIVAERDEEIFARDSTIAYHKKTVTLYKREVRDTLDAINEKNEQLNEMNELNLKLQEKHRGMCGQMSDNLKKTRETMSRMVVDKRDVRSNETSLRRRLTNLHDKHDKLLKVLGEHRYLCEWKKGRWTLVPDIDLSQKSRKSTIMIDKAIS